MTDNSQNIELTGDHAVTIERLALSDPAFRRLVEATPPERRVGIVGETIRLGSHVLEAATGHAGLQDLEKARQSLEEQSSRIVASTGAELERSVEGTLNCFAESLVAHDGPFAKALARFDPTEKGNVVDAIRTVMGEATQQATKHAVTEIREATKEQNETIIGLLTTFEGTAVAMAAQAAEAERGHAKGFEHEHLVEALLGQVLPAGDGLDDTSNVTGVLAGRKCGDKVVSPKGGCRIVVEDKRGKRWTEAAARKELATAMENREAPLGMLVVDDETKVPGCQPFHLIDDDKVIVVAELATLKLVYAYFRALALKVENEISCDEGDVIARVAELGDLVGDMRRQLEEIPKLRREHTKAITALEASREITDRIHEAVGAHVERLSAIVTLLAGGGAVDDEAA